KPLPCPDEHVVFGGELPRIPWRNGVYSVRICPLRLHGGRDIRHDTAHYIPKDKKQVSPSLHLRDTQDRLSWHPLQRRITVSYAQGPTIATSQRSSHPGRHQVSAIGSRRKEHRPPARLPYRVDRLLNREGIILDAIPACSPPLGIDLVDKPIPREEKTARPADNLPERSLKRTPDSDADSWIKDESSLIDKPERHLGGGSNGAARDRVRTLHRQGVGNNESRVSVANRGEGILKA